MENNNLQLEQFLGRVKEIETIDNAIKTSKNDIVFLTGLGGIGKTRFLQEIQKLYNNEISYIVPDIIDYDDYMLDFKRVIKEEIIKAIGEKYFQRYFEEIGYKEENVRISQHRQKDIQEKFAEGFNRGLNNKKFILLIDTLEKVTSKDFWDSFISDLKGLKNCVIILSGRGKQEKVLQGEEHSYQYLDSIYEEYFIKNAEIQNSFDIHLLNLKGFDKGMTKAYFQIKAQMLGIADNISSSDAFNCIEILTNGRPIMIDAITELIVQDGHQANPLEFLQKKFDLYDCTHLARYNKEKLIDKTNEFDKRSIEHLDVGDEGFNDLALEEKVVVYLHFIRFINRAMIEKLFGVISNDEFKRIQKFVYTKALKNDYITLHDKMEDLLQEHLKNFTDTFKLKIYEDAIKIIEEQLILYRVKKKSLEIHDLDLKRINRRIQMFQKDVMRLEFLIDEIVDNKQLLPKTFIKYKKKFNEVKLDKYREFALELVWLADEHEKYMSKEQRVQHTIYKADALTLNNVSEEAVEILGDLKNEPNLTATELLNIDNTLANSYGFMGDLQKAYSLQLGVYNGTTLYQGVQGELQKEIFVQNHIGSLLLQMTKFDESEKHLKKVIKNIKALLSKNLTEEELFQSRKSFLNLEALAYSYLSNIYRVNGEYQKALGTIDKADAIWNEIKSINNLNLTSNTRKGDAYRSEGQILKSTMAFDKAKSEIKNNVNDKEEIDLNLSIALQYLFESQKYNPLDNEQNSKKEELLGDAQKLCEDSLLECYDNIDTNRIILAREYVEGNAYLTHILLEQNQKEEAYQATMKQYKIAKERDIPFYILDAIVSLAEMKKDIKAYEEDIATIKSQYAKVPAYALLLGRLERMRADNIFEKGNYEDAFILYAQAIEKIDLHGGYAHYHIREELKKIAHKLHSLNEIEKYFTIFKEKLASIKDVQKYSKNIQEWIEDEEFEI